MDVSGFLGCCFLAVELADFGIYLNTLNISLIKKALFREALCNWCFFVTGTVSFMTF